MDRLLAAAGRSARRTYNKHGHAWHVTRSGNVIPARFDVRAELVHLAGNARPYFSITGTVRRTVGGGDRVLAFGCIHEEILHVWPDLAPLVRVHLSDDLGVPIHAAANAAYWAGETKYQGRDVARLADHLRVDRETAVAMAALAATIDAEHRAAVWSAVVFDRFGMAARWAADAASARAMLREIPSVAVAR
jgi:hypothetical protein